MPFTPVSATEAAARAAQTLATNTTTYTQTYSNETPKYGFAISLITRAQYNTAIGLAAGASAFAGTPIAGIGGLTGGAGAFPAAQAPTGGASIGTIGSLIWLPEPKGETIVDKQEIEYTEYPVGTALADFVTGGAIGALAPAVTAFTGFAINQFFTVILKGPKYKRYDFTFDLAPRTRQDSDKIRQLILTLRGAAAPGLAASGFAWTMPMIALCTYVPQGNDPTLTYMYAFKPAVIEGIQAHYAPNPGPPAFYRNTGGAPEAVRLSIAFCEIEYWLSANYGGPN